jgi:replicative DNA helicase
MPTTTTAHVPPHSIEAERSVLGAILLTGAQALEPIAHEERLGPDDFYRDRHALVYEAMLALHQCREPIDTLTVSAQLSSRGVLEQAGGEPAVDELAGWVPAAGHARAYARIVRDLATRRRVLQACYEIEQHAREGRGDVDELLADASKRIGDLLEHSLPAGSRQMHELLFDRGAELHRLVREPGEIGLQTGIGAVDRALAGMRAGELIILAARPSQGKSVLGQQIATHNALQGSGTILFSLEMSEDELADRHLSAHARVPYGKIRAAQLAERDLERIASEATGWARDTPPLVVCDRAPITIADLRSETLRWRRRLPAGVKLIVVDYLQLLSSRREDRFVNRYEQVSEISRSLKMLAKELQIPVVAVAQLSRESRTAARQTPPALRPTRLRSPGAGRQHRAVALSRRALRPERHTRAHRSDHRESPKLRMRDDRARVRGRLPALPRYTMNVGTHDQHTCGRHGHQRLPRSWLSGVRLGSFGDGAPERFGALTGDQRARLLARAWPEEENRGRDQMGAGGMADAGVAASI